MLVIMRITYLFVSFFLVSCGILGGKDGGSDSPKDSGENSDSLNLSGTVELNVAALNSDSSFASSNSEAFAGEPGSLSISTSLSQSFDLVLETAPSDEPQQIASAPPKGLKIGIKKIEIGNSSSAASNYTLFESSEAVFIEIDSGTTDLSALVSAVGNTDGSLAIKVPAGTYDTVMVTYAQGAQMKGCVEETFDSQSAYPGAKKYCTVAGKSLYDAGTVTNSDFETQQGDWMRVPLRKSFTTGPTENDNTYKTQGYMPEEMANEDMQIEYAVPKSFEVSEGSSDALTLVLDFNRLLRYYNMGDHTNSNSDYEGANPSFPVNRPHFFTTVFEDSSFVFVGKPGKAYGYDVRSTLAEIQ